jgi:hypothetical protein
MNFRMVEEIVIDFRIVREFLEFSTNIQKFSILNEFLSSFPAQYQLPFKMTICSKFFLMWGE